MGEPEFTLLDAQDLYLFNEGSHLRLWEKLGAHPAQVDGVDGTHFAVWAPNADRVSVVGDWNGWNGAAHPLRRLDSSGVWAGFVPGAARHARYKYRVESRGGAFRADKADPFAFHTEVSPRTASLVWSLEYEWGDGEWMATRRGRNSLHAPQADLRAAPGLVAAHAGRSQPLVPRARGRAAGVRRGPGLHARGAPARHGAPVLRLVGLPDDRLLRADQPLRHAAGPDVPDRPPAPRRCRRDPRLGPVALSHRRVRARRLRRHASLRARRPAPGDPPRLEELRLQLRPPRGAQLPALERAVLARALPRRRPARGCGRVDALPRLLAQARRVDPQRATAGARTSRRSTSCGGSTPRSTARTPTCRPPPKSRPPGRWSRVRPASAGSASGSSGTWAGCTTRWPTSRSTRSTGSTTTGT